MIRRELKLAKFFCAAGVQHTSDSAHIRGKIFNSMFSPEGTNSVQRFNCAPIILLAYAAFSVAGTGS